jgi:hypothetical protein
MKIYFPVLLSKAGEITALTNLSQNVKDEISPIIQVLPEGYNRVENFASTDWSFDDNEIFLDFSLCDPFDRARTRSLITNLSAAGVNVVPVLQSNSDARYAALLQNFLANGTVSNVCIRFSNGSGGFININAQIATILGALAINRNQSTILLDFGFVENHNYNMISALAINIINGINHKPDYNNIILASSSFLENLSTLTHPGRLYRIQRYEWNIWQTLIAQPGFAGIVKYGDYGTKYPFYVEANFQGSCSIKYTLPAEFIIYRGEISGNHPQGNGQYIIFADRLVRSADYSGTAFSWGDAQIDFYARQLLTNPRRRTGNATSWVEISQNHHISLLHSIL